MKLKIEQSHIIRGVRYSSRQCPIALALHDLYYDNSQPFLWITVGVAQAYVDVANSDWPSFLAGATRKEFKLSAAAQKFITNFDFNNHVEPCELELTEIAAR